MRRNCFLYRLLLVVVASTFGFSNLRNREEFLHADLNGWSFSRRPRPTADIGVTAREMARSILEPPFGDALGMPGAGPHLGVWASRQSRTSLTIQASSASSGESRTMDLKSQMNTVYPVAKIAWVWDALALQEGRTERRLRLRACAASPKLRFSSPADARLAQSGHRLLFLRARRALRMDPHFAYHTGLRSPRLGLRMYGLPQF